VISIRFTISYTRSIRPSDMAVSRRARLVAAHVGGPQSRILEFETEDDLGFTGGQYIIVQTGVPIEEGKTAKRAYSVASADATQRQFQLAVRRIDNGPGSNYMMNVPVGSEIAFSGPWGKFLPVDSSPQTVTVVATDTGITAALGLVQSRRFSESRERLALLWLIGTDEYFVPETEVRTRVAGLCSDFAVYRIPVDPQQRQAWWQREQSSVLSRLQQNQPEKVFLSGDGFLLARIRDALIQNMEAPPDIALETFFHHQAVKQQPAN
jgi:ferredoxin-NADP reductase